MPGLSALSPSSSSVAKASVTPRSSRRGSKVRQCSTCGRTFAKTDHLERHIRSHTKEKPFSCAICGRKYGRHDTLLRHQKDHAEQDAATTTDQKSRSSVSAEESEFAQNDVPEHAMSLSGEETMAASPHRAEDLVMNPDLSAPLTAPLDASALGYADGEATFEPLQADPNPSTDVYSSTFAASNQPGLALDSSSMDAFYFDFEAQFPSWLVDGDLHAGILDTPLVTTMAELRPGWPESPDVAFGSAGGRPTPNTRRLWFTIGADGGWQQDAEVPQSGPATPPESQVEVDDSYRQTLNQSLQIRPVQEQALPSADFLNLCVRSYFARFHPVFPVVHAPTFRPSKDNSMVLLSICSVGSLFTGSAHAVRQGVQIFERLHKAVLANWDRLIARGLDGRISLIQTAIIGQTFGLLSGEPRHLAIVDAFNGTLISWARRSSTFKTKKLRGLNLSLSPAELEKQWRDWAKNEELIRIALSVHIHDAELAAIFHHEPFLRHNTRQLPVAASNQTFMAARAEDWRVSYLNDPSNFDSDLSTPASIDANVDFDILAMPSNSYFTAYTVLEGICVNIVESRVGARVIPSARMLEISDLLTTFHGRFLQGAAPWEADHMDMSILWHLAFMCMCADFDLLERAIGREGSDLSPEDQMAVVNWANSDQARRCVVHGLIIQKKLENLPLGFEPAIHVPRAMFRAGIAWFCYTRFASRGGPSARGSGGGSGDGDPAATAGRRPSGVGSGGGGSADGLDFPEFKIIGVNPALLIFQANGYKHGRPSTTEINAALSGLTDLLRRIGHWEIARRFAAILSALLHDEATE